MLFLIVLIGAILRFYNLMWGGGNFFHPDENNMARSITQMTPEKGLHPDFFAYGQFPLYLSYFSAQVTFFVTRIFQFLTVFVFPTPFHFQPVPVPTAIFFLRFWSAAASTGTIVFVYKIIRSLLKNFSHELEAKTVSKKMFPFRHLHSFELFALLGASMTAFLPGLIQSAHFGTTEALLTFFFVAIVYLSIKLVEQSNERKRVVLLIAIGILEGCALGSKITALPFLAAPIAALVLQIGNYRSVKECIQSVAKIIFYVYIVVMISFIVLFLVSPYNFLDSEHFISTSKYEAEVATGVVPVFYTHQFVDKIPVLFQFTHIFPFAVGTIISFIGWVVLATSPLFVITSKERVLNKKIIVVLVSFIVFAIPNFLLYVKWTRFFTPLFPFFPIAIAAAAGMIWQAWPHSRKVIIGVMILITATTILHGLSFFSIYARDDVRKQASNWIYSHIPKGSYILFETGNVVDIPLESGTKENVKNTGTYDYTTISFDFYHLDQDHLEEKLIDHLIQADYIFIPSRRIFYNYTREPEKYPILNAYYTALFNRQLGFELVHVEKPKAFCYMLHARLAARQVTCYMNDESAEETFTVFDHPVVRIYKKIKEHQADYYQKLLD